MPFHYGKDSKGKFVHWGRHKKYYYSNASSRTRARKKAGKQAAAAYASGYKGKVKK